MSEIQQLRKAIRSYQPRRPYCDDDPGGYQESDNDYFGNNHRLAVLLLDNGEALIEAYNLLHDAHHVFGRLLDEFLTDSDGNQYEEDDEVAEQVRSLCMAISNLKRKLK